LNNTKEFGKPPNKHNRLYLISGKSPTLMQEDPIKILKCGHGFNREGVKESKAPELTTNSFENNNYLLSETVIRRLTPAECARLQTVPEWYKWDCSDTQQYKMLGNGWTIEVIKHILSYLPDKFIKNK
jgi:site-specific DNA-cytosine methylase